MSNSSGRNLEVLTLPVGLRTRVSYARQHNNGYSLSSATFPIDLDGHVLLAAGPIDILAIRDTCPACSPADFNRDNVVNEIDLAFFFAVLGQVCVGDNSEACAADLNHDGGVGSDDLSMLLRYWGPCGVAKFSVPAMGLDGRR